MLGVKKELTYQKERFQLLANWPWQFSGWHFPCKKSQMSIKSLHHPSYDTMVPLVRGGGGASLRPQVLGADGRDPEIRGPPGFLQNQSTDWGLEVWTSVLWIGARRVGIHGQLTFPAVFWAGILNCRWSDPWVVWLPSRSPARFSCATTHCWHHPGIAVEGENSCSFANKVNKICGLC